LDAETIAAMTVATTAARNPVVVVADVSVAVAVAVAAGVPVPLQVAGICRPPNTLRRRVLPWEASAVANRAAQVRIVARNLVASSLAVSKIGALKILAMVVLLPPRPVSMPSKSPFFFPVNLSRNIAISLSLLLPLL
jgi:hypothetical protein